MKLRRNNSRARTGLMLVECMVYIALLLMLTAAAGVAFYYCWRDTDRVMSATGDVSAALRAGELWRADVRQASGTIAVQTTSSGEILTIPEGQKEILYRFGSGRVQRQVGSEKFPQLLLPRVKSSDMEPETRHGVRAWRWELELARGHNDIHIPLLFTFEAAQKTP